MSEYIRTTRECSLDGLRSDLVAAIRAQVEAYELGIDESSALICIESTATKQKKGLFGGGEVIVTGVLLTPIWIIWAVAKNNEKPAVLSAKLRDIEAQDYEKSPMHKLMPDVGVNISGQYTDVAQQGMSFIGLGPEPAGRKFQQALHEAIRRVNS